MPPAPSLRSGSRLHIGPMLDAGPSLRSGPGLTSLTWLEASSPGAIFCERPVRARSFCECPVRARSFERAHPLAASLLFKNGAGAERLAARVCARGQILRGLGGPGEVTSPLFSINSILNANWYKRSSESLRISRRSFAQLYCGKRENGRAGEGRSLRTLALKTWHSCWVDRYSAGPRNLAAPPEFLR